MASRSLLIVGFVAGVVAGVALFAAALAVVALDGSALSGQLMATLVLGTMFGFALDAMWLTIAVGRISKLGRGTDDDEDGDGWGNPAPDPVRPTPPSADPDWWPAFERDFRAYRDAREREPVAD